MHQITPADAEAAPPHLLSAIAVPPFAVGPGLAGGRAWSWRRLGHRFGSLRYRDGEAAVAGMVGAGMPLPQAGLPGHRGRSLAGCSRRRLASLGASRRIASFWRRGLSQDARGVAGAPPGARIVAGDAVSRKMLAASLALRPALASLLATRWRPEGPPMACACRSRSAILPKPSRSSTPWRLYGQDFHSARGGQVPEEYAR